MWRCEDEKMWSEMWRWEDVKMSRYEDEKLWRWADVKMSRCEDVKMRRCEDQKMWRWEGVKMRRCEDEKMWRWEDVKMRRCEDEKMWRWEDVRMRRWETDPHYWKNPALRRSREKRNNKAGLWCLAWWWKKAVESSLWKALKAPHYINIVVGASSILFDGPSAVSSI